MLVDFERGLVLLTPPKCATCTLHEILPRFGAKAVQGPQFDSGVGEHTTLLPHDVWSQLDRFRFVVATRNPYTRAASLYGHYRRYWPAPHLGFGDFLAEIVFAPRHLFFNATIASVLYPLENPLDGRRPVRVEAFMRVEVLAGDLRRLGYAVGDDLPRLHALRNPGVADYTPKTRELVELWSRHDFDRFGYSRELARAQEPGGEGPPR